MDLNPDSSYSGLTAGQFPITFVNGINVNENDTYKKSKIVFQKIDKISGENSDTF